MLLWDTIETQRTMFSATDLKLIEYIREHPNIVFKSITEVLEESGVSYGSIIRFTKKIGCSGFQDFKIRLAAENSQLETQAKAGDDASSFAESYLRDAEKQLKITVRNIDERELVRVARLLTDAQRIVVTGVGGSFPMADELVYRLLRMGFDNVTLDADEHTQAYRIATLGPEDLLVVFSYSGSTKSILETVGLAKRHGVRIVSFTNHVKSPLMELSDCSLITSILVPALQAELATKLPFYFLIELLSSYLYEVHNPARLALQSTYDAVSDKQI